MRRTLISLLALVLSLPAFSQDLLTRIREVNMTPTLQAAWHRTYHSPLLEQPLESDGMVYIQEPSRLRWETVSPISSIIVFTGEEERSRFRMPSEKDFSAEILEGEQYTVVLTPVRRDLKQLFKQILLTADTTSLVLSQVIIKGRDGDWTLLAFKDIKYNVALPATLFQK